MDEIHYAFYTDTGPLLVDSFEPESEPELQGAEIIGEMLDGGPISFNYISKKRTQFRHGTEYNEENLPPLAQTRHVLVDKFKEEERKALQEYREQGELRQKELFEDVQAVARETKTGLEIFFANTTDHDVEL